MFLSLAVDTLKYKYSKIHAFIFSGIWFLLFIAFLIKEISRFPESDWWAIMLVILIGLNLIISIKLYLFPALTSKIAIEVTEEYILNEDKQIAFTAINDFVLYDSGVIAVMLNEAAKRPKSPLKWLSYWFKLLFYRSTIIIDTRHVNVKAPALFNSLVTKLDNSQLNAAL